MRRVDLKELNQEELIDLVMELQTKLEVMTASYKSLLARLVNLYPIWRYPVETGNHEIKYE